MISNLYSNINYSSDISYLNNIFIREYDISKANISVLFEKGIIDQETYERLYNSERMVRQIYIGNMQRNNPESVKILQNGIIEAKEKLFESNNIQDYEVLSIKNDAVFIINRKLHNTTFGLINFNSKNTYTSYYKIMNLEMYYYYNAVSKEESIDIKGIGDDKLKLHNEYFLHFLKDLFYVIQNADECAGMKMLKDFYMDYISYKLSVNFYRSFDSRSIFHYKNKSFSNAGFYSINVSDHDKYNLDITYNIKILFELQKILSSMYFSKHK